ncbi:MAG TPA: hypothetical protein VLS90_08760, partial [Thermodesulfobacteriota bacterium]|nr:hypothetical protein [Thermodesulfobacteriota bacterium]
KIRAAVKVPVIAVGRIQIRRTAERILREGQADMIALARQLLADPFWPRKILEGREDQVVLCTYCDHCTNEMRAGRPITCANNANL